MISPPLSTLMTVLLLAATAMPDIPMLTTTYPMSAPVFVSACHSRRWTPWRTFLISKSAQKKVLRWRKAALRRTLQRRPQCNLAPAAATRRVSQHSATAVLAALVLEVLAGL